MRARVIVRQLGAALVTLLVISVVTFAATNVKSPEGIARAKLGREATQAQLRAFMEAHELDRPVHTRYLAWLSDFVKGNWGVSVVTDSPVRPEVVPRFVRTLTLAVVALLVTLPLSVGLGVFMARRIGTGPDLVLLMATVVIAAMPEFVIGIGLLLIFSVALGWLPVDSATSLLFASSVTSTVKAYALPALTLVLSMAPYMIRITRASASEALAALYTQAAVLRGLRRRTVVWDHAMRNAGVSLVNALALNTVFLLGGVIVVENVFAFPGIGQMLVQAIATGDTITVQAIALVMGAMFIGIALIADVAVTYLNPRLKAAT